MNVPTVMGSEGTRVRTAAPTLFPVARLGSDRMRLPGNIRAIDLCDGVLVAAAERIGAWEVPSLRPLWSLSASVDGLALGAKNRVLALAGAAVEVFDPYTGRERIALQASSFPSRSVALSPDGKWLAAGSSRCGELRVWSLQTGSVVCAWKHPTATEVRSLCFSSDGSTLAAAFGTEQLVLLHPDKPGGHPLPFQGPRTNQLSFLPRSSALLGGGEDGRVRVWDLSSPRPRLAGELPTQASGSISQLICSIDGTCFAVLRGSSMELVDARSWRATARWNTGTPVSTARFVPGKPWLALAGPGTEVSFWDYEHDARVEDPRNIGARSPVDVLSVAADGRFAVSAGEDGLARVWSLPSGTMLHKAPLTHASSVRSISVSPSGRTIVTGCEDGSLTLWNTADGTRRLHIEKAHSAVVRAIACANDGAWMATAGGDGLVCLRPTRSGHALRVLEKERHAILHLVFLRDGSLLTVGPQAAHVLSIPSGTVQKSWRYARIRAAATDLERGILHTVRDHTGQVEARSLEDGSSLGLVSGNEVPAMITCDPSNGRVAWACFDGPVVLWNPGPRSLPRRVLSAGFRVRSLALLPARGGLLAGLADGTVWLFGDETASLSSDERAA